MRVPKNSQKLFESTLVQKNWLTTEELQTIQQKNPEVPLEESLLKIGKLTQEQLKIVLKEVRAQMYQGKSFGKYEVLYKIAKGAMGEVYKVRHRELDKIYALKMVRGCDLSSQETLLRFEQEAQLVAKFDHPNIIQIYDFGQVEQKHYLVMEYIQGAQTLENRIKQGLDREEGIHLLIKILHALHYAHQKKILHRDIKPENILITPEGEPKIIDFGLATEQKRIENESEKKQITWVGQILGTPAYMSPEQACGDQELDARTDIYSMGVCLYQILTERCPHEAENVPFLLYKIMTEKINPPSFFRKETPKDLDFITLKALSRDREERYPTAKAFEEDLKCFQKGLPLLSKNTTPQEKAVKWAKRNVFVFLFFGFFALFTALSFLIAFGNRIYQQEQQFKKICLRAQEFETQAIHAITREEKIYYFLQEQGQLTLALSLKPNHPFIENKKFENGKTLIRFLCQENSNHLAQYLIQELLSLATLRKNQKSLLEKIPAEEREKSIAEQKEKFRRWVNRLSQEELDNETLAEAVLEISDMRIPEVFERLLFYLQEGTDYFIKNPPPSTLKENFYSTLLQALGRQENSNASLYLVQSLKSFFSFIQNDPSPSFTSKQEIYITGIFNALIHTLNPQNATELYEKIVMMKRVLIHILGEESYFKRNSQWAEQKLALLVPNYPSKFPETSQPKPTIETRNEVESLIYQGNFQKAILLLDEYIACYPKDVQGYMLRGYAQDSLRNFQKACEDYTTALQFANEDRYKIYSYRGFSYTNLKKYSEALADYNEAIRIDPRFVEVYNQRGFLKREMGDVEGAERDYTTSLRLNPNQPMTYNNRGNVYIFQNKFDLALKDYNQAVQLAPQNAMFYYNRAKLKILQKKLEEAHQDLSQAILLDPKNSEYFYLQGELKIGYKDFEGAVSSYDEALKREPKMLLAHLGRIQAHLYQNNVDVAESAFLQIIPLLKDITFADDIVLENKVNRVLTLFLQKNHFEEKIKSFTDRQMIATIFYHRGKRFEKQNELEQAIFAYENALRFDIESPARPIFLDLLLQRCFQNYRQKLLKEAESDLLLFQKYAPLDHPERKQIQRILENIQQESSK